MGLYEFPEPLPVRRIERGFHCVTGCYIGNVRFRITCDTGCARDFVRTQFCNQLKKDAQTKGSVILTERGSREINCTGIVTEMKTPSVTRHTTVKLRFQDVPEDGSAPMKPVSVDVVFGEMDSGADCLLLGFPTLVDWGYQCFNDGDGNPWIRFEKFSITLPCEKPGKN